MRTIINLFIASLALSVGYCQPDSPVYFSNGTWEVTDISPYQSTGLCLPNGTVTFSSDGDSGLDMTATQWLGDGCSDFSLDSSSDAMYFPFDNLPGYDYDNSSSYCSSDFCFSLETASTNDFRLTIARGGWSATVHLQRTGTVNTNSQGNTPSGNTGSSTGSNTSGNDNSNSQSSSSSGSNSGSSSSGNSQSSGSSTSGNTISTPGTTNGQTIPTNSSSYFYDNWAVNTMDVSGVDGESDMECLPAGTVSFTSSGSGMYMRASRWEGSACSELGLTSAAGSWYWPYNSLGNYNDEDSTSYCSSAYCFELESITSGSFVVKVTETDWTGVISFARANTTVSFGSTAFNFKPLASNIFNLTDILNGKLSFSFGSNVLYNCNGTANTWGSYHDNLGNCYDIASQNPTYTLTDASNSAEGFTITYPIVTYSTLGRSFQLIIDLSCDLDATSAAYTDFTVSLFLNNSINLETFVVSGSSRYGCPSYMYSTNSTNSSSASSASSSTSDSSDEEEEGTIVCGPIIIDSQYVFNICPFNESGTFKLSDIIGGSLSFGLATTRLTQCPQSEAMWAVYDDNSGDCYEVAPLNPTFSLYNEANPNQGLQIIYPVAVSHDYYTRSFQLVVNLICDIENVDPELTPFTMDTDLGETQVMTVTGKTIYGCRVDPDASIEI